MKLLLLGATGRLGAHILEKRMKLLLLGATGRLGAHILEKLVRAQHEVHTLVRDRSKVFALRYKGLMV